jgi:hypothetical protein
MTQVILATNNAIISGSRCLASPTGPALVQWDTAYFNVQRGITYSTGTKRFTLSVSGIYTIQWVVFRDSASASPFSGGIGVNTDAPTYVTNKAGFYTTLAAGYLGYPVLVTLPLVANDYITFYVATGTAYSGGPTEGGYNAFSIIQVG